MQNVFLVKLHSDRCPAGIGRPRRGTGWEAGWFNIPERVSTIMGGREGAPPPSPGDRVYVWIHER